MDAGLLKKQRSTTADCDTVSMDSDSREEGNFKKVNLDIL